MVVLVVIAAVLAAIAVCAAIVAVRAVRRMGAQDGGKPATPVCSSQELSPYRVTLTRPASTYPGEASYRSQLSDDRLTEAHDGRVIARPSQRDVVEATMGRPLVRLSMLAYGVAHAIRPESRDRIGALMRREYRQRRRARLRAGRRAVKATYQPELNAPQHWTTAEGHGEDEA